MFFGALRLVEGFYLGEGMIRIAKGSVSFKIQNQGRLSSNFQLRQKVFEKVERKVVMIWLCPSYP